MEPSVETKFYIILVFAVLGWIACAAGFLFGFYHFCKWLF